MRIIAVSNQKGGVGKTTTAVNLSAALAGKNKQVLLIDLDPQGNASTALGLRDPERLSLYHALTGAKPISELIHPTRIQNLSGISADLDLAGAEVEIAKMDGHLFQLRNALQPLRDQQAFDFIIMDCPPSLGILMTNALVAADEILIPIQCEYYALEGLGLLMQVYNEIRNSGANPQLTISGLLMTMYDSRTNLNTAVVKDVQEHFKELIYETRIPRTIRFGEAPSHGLTILEYDPLSSGSAAYRAAAEEFLGRVSGRAF